MKYVVTIDGRETVVEVTGEGVRVDGVETPAELRRIDGTDRWSLRLGDRTHEVAATSPASGTWALSVDGRAVDADAVDERTHHIRSMATALSGAQGPRPVKAPMPGLVVRVEVEEGEVVQPGRGLVIVEAMKMENELRADTEARVAKILVAAGDTVNKDQVLIEMAAVEAEADA